MAKTITATASTSTRSPSSHERSDRASMDGGNWKMFSIVRSASYAEADDHAAYRALPDAAPVIPASLPLSTLQWSSDQVNNGSTNADKSNESASWSLFDNAAVDDNWFVAAMSASTKPANVEGLDSSLLSPSPSGTSPLSSSASSALDVPLDSEMSSVQSSTAPFLAAESSRAGAGDSLQDGNMELRPVLPDGFDGEFEYRPLLASAWLVNRSVFSHFCIRCRAVIWPSEI